MCCCVAVFAAVLVSPCLCLGVRVRLVFDLVFPCSLSIFSPYLPRRAARSRSRLSVKDAHRFVSLFRLTLFLSCPCKARSPSFDVFFLLLLPAATSHLLTPTTRSFLSCTDRITSPSCLQLLLRPVRISQQPTHPKVIPEKVTDGGHGSGGPSRRFPPRQTERSEPGKTDR